MALNPNQTQDQSQAMTKEEYDQLQADLATSIDVTDQYSTNSQQEQNESQTQTSVMQDKNPPIREIDLIIEAVAKHPVIANDMSYTMADTNNHLTPISNHLDEKTNASPQQSAAIYQDLVRQQVHLNIQNAPAENHQALTEAAQPALVEATKDYYNNSLIVDDFAEVMPDNNNALEPQQRNTLSNALQELPLEQQQLVYHDLNQAWNKKPDMSFRDTIAAVGVTLSDYDKVREQFLPLDPKTEYLFNESLINAANNEPNMGAGSLPSFVITAAQKSDMDIIYKAVDSDEHLKAQAITGKALKPIFENTVLPVVAAANRKDSENNIAPPSATTTANEVAAVYIDSISNKLAQEHSNRYYEPHSDSHTPVLGNNAASVAAVAKDYYNTSALTSDFQDTVRLPDSLSSGDAAVIQDSVKDLSLGSRQLIDHKLQTLMNAPITADKPLDVNDTVTAIQEVLTRHDAMLEGTGINPTIDNTSGFDATSNLDKFHNILRFNVEYSPDAQNITVPLPPAPPKKPTPKSRTATTDANDVNPLGFDQPELEAKEQARDNQVDAEQVANSEKVAANEARFANSNDNAGYDDGYDPSDDHGYDANYNAANVGSSDMPPPMDIPASAYEDEFSRSQSDIDIDNATAESVGAVQPKTNSGSSNKSQPKPKTSTAAAAAAAIAAASKKTSGSAPKVSSPDATVTPPVEVLLYAVEQSPFYPKYDLDTHELEVELLNTSKALDNLKGKDKPSESLVVAILHNELASHTNALRDEKMKSDPDMPFVEKTNLINATDATLRGMNAAQLRRNPDLRNQMATIEAPYGSDDICTDDQRDALDGGISRLPYGSQQYVLSEMKSAKEKNNEFGFGNALYSIHKSLTEFDKTHKSVNPNAPSQITQFAKNFNAAAERINQKDKNPNNPPAVALLDTTGKSFTAERTSEGNKNTGGDKGTGSDNTHRNADNEIEDPENDLNHPSNKRGSAGSGFSISMFNFANNSSNTVNRAPTNTPSSAPNQKNDGGDSMTPAEREALNEQQLRKASGANWSTEEEKAAHLKAESDKKAAKDAHKPLFGDTMADDDHEGLIKQHKKLMEKYADPNAKAEELHNDTEQFLEKTKELTERAATLIEQQQQDEDRLKSIQKGLKDVSKLKEETEKSAKKKGLLDKDHALNKGKDDKGKDKKPLGEKFDDVTAGLKGAMTSVVGFIKGIKSALTGNKPS